MWYGKGMWDTSCSLQKPLTGIYKGRRFFTDHQLTQNNAQNHVQMLSACIHMLFPPCVGYLLFMVAFNLLATFSKCLPRPTPTDTCIHLYTYTQCMCPHLGESRSTPCTEACCAFLETRSCFTVVWKFKYVQWASGLCLLSVYAIFPNLLLSALLCNKSWTLKTSLLCQLAPCLASRRMKWRFFFSFYELLFSFCSCAIEPVACRFHLLLTLRIAVTACVSHRLPAIEFLSVPQLASWCPSLGSTPMGKLLPSPVLIDSLEPAEKVSVE